MVVLEARAIDLAEAIEQTDLDLEEHRRERLPRLWLGHALDHVAVRALLTLPVALRRQHLVDRFERLQARGSSLPAALGCREEAVERLL